MTNAWLLLCKTAPNLCRAFLIDRDANLSSLLSEELVGGVPEALVRYAVEKSFQLKGSLYRAVYNPLEDSLVATIELYQSEIILRTIKRQSDFPPASYLILITDILTNFNVLDIPFINNPLVKTWEFRKTSKSAYAEWNNLKVGETMRLEIISF